MKSSPLLYALAVFVSTLWSAIEAAKVSCKNEKGRSVDWFYMYKLPKHYNSNKNESTGLNYLFVTSNDTAGWQLSNHTVKEFSSMTGVTLSPLFDDPSVLLIAYNDEYPNGTVLLNNGHTKGVVATDGNTSIWLIHSVPKFPAIPEYDYPTTGEHYGQSFLCLTLNADQMNAVGKQLIFNEPNIYFSRIPRALEKKYRDLEKAIAGEWRSEAPYESAVTLTTRGGVNFKSFAKSTKYGKDLYEDLMAPELSVNLFVESWRNGGGNLASNCSKSSKVYNVASIKSNDLNLSFKSTKDHSKWAVAESIGWKLWRWRYSGNDWICVGDINRQQHQSQRGGGSVCQNNGKIAKLYRQLIDSFDPCQKSEINIDKFNEPDERLFS